MKPLTDFVMDVEGTWYAAYVQGGGDVLVLAVSEDDARKIIEARYPAKAYSFGLSKSRPASGDVYLKQVPVIVYDPARSDPKDIAEAKRRGDVNYEQPTR